MRAVGAVCLQAISASPDKHLIFADSSDEDSPVWRCVNQRPLGQIEAVAVLIVDHLGLSDRG